jgi:hypothetical protein
MRKEEIQVAIAEEVIIRKIYNIRGKQVMLSQDLAELKNRPRIGFKTSK